MKVVCIVEFGYWNNDRTGLTCDDNYHPTKGSICTIVNTSTFKNKLYYSFKEYNLKDYYFSGDFVPLDDYLSQFDEALEEELKEIQELVTV